MEEAKNPKEGEKGCFALVDELLLMGEMKSVIINISVCGLCSMECRPNGRESERMTQLLFWRQIE